MTDSQRYTVLYDYEDAPTLKRFALCNKRVRLAMGPFGCIAGDTLIVTEEGLLPISDLTHPVRVLSWNEKTNRFQFSLSGGAFPKGKDYLYRVSTQQGEFVAAGHHRVLCGDNKYRQVSDLHQGDFLKKYSVSHLQKFALAIQKLFQKGDLHSSEKFSYFHDCCVRLNHLYGQQLQMATSNDQVFVPLPTDVQRLFFLGDLEFAEHTDDLLEQLPKHNRPDQSFCQKQTDDYFLPVENHNAIDLNQTELLFFSRIWQKFLKYLQLPLKIAFRHIKKLFVLCSNSCSSSLPECILSIKRETVNKIYWDMQVLDTNNYVTADGTIHHNSGKSSAMVMEVIRKAHEQIPSPDGIRRSRWAVIRNSYGQLKDTTIKTFHDWFPPKVFGEYYVTNHSYIFTKFPGVELEVLFRALDRPDQVSNLLSLELTGAWFNEAREIPKTIIEAMDGRIGRYPSQRDGGCSWYGMILDSNPPDDDSYLYKMFEVVKPDNWEIFKQPSGLSAHAENLKHLPKNYYINLAKGKDEMYIRIYIHGQYGYLVQGKPVFTGFVDNVHVAPNILEPIKGLDLLIGLDFGLQPACSIGQITHYGQLRILDELVSDGMAIRQFCVNQLLPLLRTKYFGYNVMGYGDPSGTSRSPTDESTCFDVLHSPEIGLTNIVPAPTNAIVPRVNAVDHFLSKMVNGEPGFLLSPNCRYLRKAMNGGYHYALEKSFRGGVQEAKMMPVKNFSSHCADSLEELCLYIDEKQEYDKQKKEFLAKLKHQQPHHPASRTAGY